MSTNRYGVLDRDFPVRVDDQGRRLCRWCRTPVTPPKRNWCGDQKCFYEVAIRTNPGFARSEVFKRDKGVCAGCGVDCPAVEEKIEELRLDKDRIGEIEALWATVSDGPWPRYGSHTWEADHIVPVVEGGGGTGLDNLRTLCLRCHRRETAKLAARRAADRRREGQVLL